MMQLLDFGFRSLPARPAKPADEIETLEAKAKAPLRLAGTNTFDFSPIPVAAQAAAESPRPVVRKVVQRRTAKRPVPKASAMLAKASISAKS